MRKRNLNTVEDFYNQNEGFGDMLKIAEQHFYKAARPTAAKIELLKKQGLTTEQIELCIQTDPTEKDYVQWIASNLKKKTIRLPEDSDKIKSQLTAFLKLKQSPKFTGSKDLNTYTPATLFETVGGEGDTSEAEEIEIPWAIMTNSQKDNWLKKNHQKLSQKWFAGQDTPGVKITCNQEVEDHNYKIFKVSDPFALAMLSIGSNWCTKSPDTARHYLSKGANYLFYLDNRPYGQCDPSSRSIKILRMKTFPLNLVN